MPKPNFTLTCQSSSDDDSSEATFVNEDNCIVETSSDESCDEAILSATILPTQLSPPRKTDPVILNLLSPKKMSPKKNAS